MAEYQYNINDLADVMKALLSQNGCPWDKAQTHTTLRKYLIEECYEAVEAINKNDMDNLCEELGDILFQVMFHSELAKKEGYFTLDRVINDITKKMIYRHPHVFLNEGGNTQDEIIDNWDKLKEKEKKYKSPQDIISSVPHSLPALMRGQKVISKAIKYNKCSDDLNSSVKEADRLWSEFKSTKNPNMELIGNFLLEFTKISHFLQINAEFSLTNAIEKFINNNEDI